MATFPAIAATSRAILGLLEAAAAADTEFNGTQFALYRGADLGKPMASGVSLYLHRVVVNSQYRNHQPRIDELGRKWRPAVPLDLHYLLTAWAEDAVRQQRLLGWCIRVIQDTQTLPSGLLNHFGPEHDVFGPTETVDVLLEPLSMQDMSYVWEGADARREPSATYVARILELESLDVERVEPLVQTRDFGLDSQVPKPLVPA